MLADDDGRRHFLDNALLQPVAKLPKSFGPVISFLLPALQGRAHADGQGECFGAGPQTRLLVAAELRRSQADLVSYDQCAAAQRARRAVGGNAGRLELGGVPLLG